jgi:hypothetical protein
MSHVWLTCSEAFLGIYVQIFLYLHVQLITGSEKNVQRLEGEYYQQ